jgi:type II secretory pathway pseudopilin PulG
MGKMVPMPSSYTVRFRLVELLVVAGCAMLLAALLLPAIFAAREAARRSSCENNLKQLSLGVLNYSDAFGRFPLGTSGSRGLSPAQRFSWYLPLWHFWEGKPPTLLVNQNQPWDAEVNRSPRLRHIVDWGEPTERTEDYPLSYLHRFGCPSAPRNEQVLGIQVARHAGMTGLGVKSPEVGSEEPGVGMWGYDRQLTSRDIQDGASATILLLETNLDPGAWIAGGRPTLRSLESNVIPYLGVGGQFGGIHSGTCPIVMADASVRQLDNEMDLSVLSAMTTIAGRD